MTKYQRVVLDIQFEVTDPEALDEFTTKVSKSGVASGRNTQEQTRIALSRMLGEALRHYGAESGLRPLLHNVTSRQLDEDGHWKEMILYRAGGRDADGNVRNIEE